MLRIDIDVSQTIEILLVPVFVGVRLSDDADRRFAILPAQHHAGDKMRVERELEIIRQGVFRMIGEVVHDENVPGLGGRFSSPSMM